MPGTTKLRFDRRSFRRWGVNFWDLADSWPLPKILAAEKVGWSHKDFLHSHNLSEMMIFMMKWDLFILGNGTCWDNWGNLQAFTHHDHMQVKAHGFPVDVPSESWRSKALRSLGKCIWSHHVWRHRGEPVWARNVDVHFFGAGDGKWLKSQSWGWVKTSQHHHVPIYEQNG